MKALKLVVPVTLCLMIKRLAHQNRELVAEGHNQALCHICVINASLVERLYNLNYPGSCGIHSHWSHTLQLFRQQERKNTVRNMSAFSVCQ